MVAKKEKTRDAVNAVNAVNAVIGKHILDKLSADQTNAAAMPPAINLLLRVHELEQLMGVIPKPPPRRGSLPSPNRTKAYYAPGDSTVITAADLDALSPVTSRMVAAALWFADFKWLTGTKRDGFATHVHFGYSSQYSDDMRHSEGVFRNFRLCGSVMSFPVNNIVERRSLHSIEVPLSAESYIFVRQR